MSMLDRRLQVLIDDARFRGLEEEAKRRKASVAEIVREAIDAVLDASDSERRAAWERLRVGPKLPATNLDDVKALIDEARSGTA